MVKYLILHIGNHKTGTTALQHFCAANAGLLRRYGVHWPHIKPEAHGSQHSQLALDTRHGRLDVVRCYLDTAFREADALGIETVLLSGEEFSNIGQPKIEAFLAQVPSSVEVRVVVYLRNVHEMILAVMMEKWKAGKAFSHPGNTLRQLAIKVDYPRLLRKWQRLIGRQQVFAYCYDLERTHLFEHFFTQITGACKAPDGLLTATRSDRGADSNRSLPFALAAYLHFAGQPLGAQEQNKLAETLAAQGGHGGYTQAAADFAAFIWAQCIKDFGIRVEAFEQGKLKPYAARLLAPLAVGDAPLALEQLRAVLSAVEPATGRSRADDLE